MSSRHRNESYGRKRSPISDRFSRSPSRGFKGINCRTFESGVSAGILPSPPPSFTGPVNSHHNHKHSSPIPIAAKWSPKHRDDASSSELWAGPAYCNSPPPSSLPIPTFSLRQKRSVSLDLPSQPTIVLRPTAKSAPSSPTKVASSPESDFFFSTAFATQNLRRILNLDINDD